MNGSLSAEFMNSLIESVPCRDTQIRQLAALLDARFPSPSTIVIHGHEATGKTLTLRKLLSYIDTPSAIVRSQECITPRHLLERALSASSEALATGSPDDLVKGLDKRCESISTFTVQLERLLEGRGKFILVFDGIDQQREALPTLIAAIARLGEIISGLTVIFIVHAPRFRALNLAGVPHVQFPPYSRAESLFILSSSPLSLYDPSPPDDTSSNDPLSVSISDDDKSWLWSRFVTAAWDSLGQAAARDIVSFRAVCEKLWNPFVKPVLEGHYNPREFSKLMVKNRALFQSELPLKESVLSFNLMDPTPTPTHPPLVFPYYTAYLLCAAYLASHTPPRNDILLFSKSSLTTRRRKKGGGTPAQSRGRTPKHRKPSRHLLGPQPFSLERLFAIFHAILPSPIGGGRADLMEQVATLRRLRLLVIRGASIGDEGLAGGKWRVGCGLEFVRGVARGVGLDLEEFFGG